MIVNAQIILGKREVVSLKYTITPGHEGPLAVVHLASGVALATSEPTHLRTLARALVDAASALEAAQDAALVALKEG